MYAMVMDQVGSPLQWRDVPTPRPRRGELLLAVKACGLCRTDLHVADGDLPHPTLPLILGHQIVGQVVEAGAGVSNFHIGDRVGVPWLGGSCGCCEFCLSHQENLCDHAVYTGYQRDGGFAEFTVAAAQYCLALPAGFADEQAAPLLCAGLIGYRCYRKAKEAQRLGLYGFGAAAHILAQLACHEGKTVSAFTRPGDVAAQQFALRLGVAWAGGTDEKPPEPLDAAILFAPVGSLVPIALGHVRKGGTVVCGGIHMTDIPAFPYRLLWEERSLTSVANLTRRDGEEFLPLAASVPIVTEVHSYPLAKANEALADLRQGRFTGAAVIVP